MRRLRTGKCSALWRVPGGYSLMSAPAAAKKADMISMQLASIMKTLLVKRIDSSFFAFKQSLRRYFDANKVMLDMFENGEVRAAHQKPLYSVFLLAQKEDSSYPPTRVNNHRHVHYLHPKQAANQVPTAEG